ncbi:hypothetical protein CS0771_11110 [Catellatospora sp. IY07-71]|uniref:hypothetical protein n=1 Tax=Catellatospora sp. IY07-71 TaxID=2728827 RepID=UPI001BB3B21E|nr:hypothetical protein [Catellatospora sp. IY07-71]BCJ71567.1 hypothetical protein CS0771_11110 [Catellatospora sp. IY07-71]
MWQILRVPSQIKRARSWNWLGIVLGLVPGVVSLAVGILAVPPRVLRRYDEYGQVLHYGNNDYTMDRPLEMIFPTIVGYGIFLTVTLVMVALRIQLRFVLNLVIGLVAGMGLLMIGCFAQRFLDVWVRV